jgi:flagellar hook-basal body complex protein FliE
MSDSLKINPEAMRVGRLDTPQMRPAQSRALGTEHKSFADTLTESISEVQRLQTEADTTIKKVVSGEINDVSEAMVQLQQADTAFKTMMTVRGKVMDAYAEIMRMQI